MQNKSIGIDLGKPTFHLVALNSRSRVVVRKKFLGQQCAEDCSGLSPKDSMCGEATSSTV